MTEINSTIHEAKYFSETEFQEWVSKPLKTKEMDNISSSYSHKE
jgi:hypothetical protein